MYSAMSRIESATVDSLPTERWRATPSPDRGALSLLFDELSLASTEADSDPRPNALRLRGRLQLSTPSWIAVQLRGSVEPGLGQGLALVQCWVNGRRLRNCALAGEPLLLAGQVQSGGELRFHLLLLAQRDLDEANSHAQCWVDSMDFALLRAPRKI